MEDWHSFGKSYVMTLRCWLDLIRDWKANGSGDGVTIPFFWSVKFPDAPNVWTIHQYLPTWKVKIGHMNKGEMAW